MVGSDWFPAPVAVLIVMGVLFDVGRMLASRDAIVSVVLVVVVRVALVVGVMRVLVMGVWIPLAVLVTVGLPFAPFTI